MNWINSVKVFGQQSDKHKDWENKALEGWGRVYSNRQNRRDQINVLLKLNDTKLTSSLQKEIKRLKNEKRTLIKQYKFMNEINDLGNKSGINPSKISRNQCSDTIPPLEDISSKYLLENDNHSDKLTENG